MLRESLEKIINNCEGAVAGLIMGFDGITVEKISRENAADVRMISREFSFILSQVRRAAEILEVGALEEVSIRSEDLTFIIRILNDDYFLSVALKPSGNFGKGRFLMRMALPDLLSQI